RSLPLNSAQFRRLGSGVEPCAACDQGRLTPGAGPGARLISHLEMTARPQPPFQPSQVVEQFVDGLVSLGAILTQRPADDFPERGGHACAERRRFALRYRMDNILPCGAIEWEAPGDHLIDQHAPAEDVSALVHR